MPDRFRSFFPRVGAPLGDALPLYQTSMGFELAPNDPPSPARVESRAPSGRGAGRRQRSMSGTRFQSEDYPLAATDAPLSRPPVRAPMAGDETATMVVVSVRDVTAQDATGVDLSVLGVVTDPGAPAAGEQGLPGLTSAAAEDGRQIDESVMADLLVEFKQSRPGPGSDFEISQAMGMLLNRFQYHMIEEANNTLLEVSEALELDVLLFSSLADLDLKQVDNAVRNRMHNG